MNTRRPRRRREGQRKGYYSDSSDSSQCANRKRAPARVVSRQGHKHKDSDHMIKVQLMSHLQSVTDEASSTFEPVKNNITVNRSRKTNEGVYECDCRPEYFDDGGQAGVCADEACINRSMQMECPPWAPCGSTCDNRRIQHHQHANVDVIKTQLKGYGLRCKEAVEKGDLIIEYVGEVVSKAEYHSRILVYQQEQLPHIYFMDLAGGEMIDATKRGNLARFVNHSCRPNCYTELWTVNGKNRRALFAKRRIQAGEELTFDYKIDRYGAVPQRCFCGEENCKGTLGSAIQPGEKTRTIVPSKPATPAPPTVTVKMPHYPLVKKKLENYALQDKDVKRELPATPTTVMQPEEVARIEGSGIIEISDDEPDSAVDSEIMDKGFEDDEHGSNMSSLSDLDEDAVAVQAGKARENENKKPSHTGQLVMGPEPQPQPQAAAEPGSTPVPEPESEKTTPPPKPLEEQKTPRAKRPLTVDEQLAELDFYVEIDPKITALLDLTPFQCKSLTLGLSKLRQSQPHLSDVDLLNRCTRKVPVNKLVKKSIGKVMSTLLQSHDIWLIRLLVKRVHKTEGLDENYELMRLHGYQVFSNVIERLLPGGAPTVGLILLVMKRWPRYSRNKISASTIEQSVQKVVDHMYGDENNTTNYRILEDAKFLLSEWKVLTQSYRIPKKPLPESEIVNSDKDEDAEAEQESGNAAATASGRQPNQQVPTTVKRSETVELDSDIEVLGSPSDESDVVVDSVASQRHASDHQPPAPPRKKSPATNNNGKVSNHRINNAHDHDHDYNASDSDNGGSSDGNYRPSRPELIELHSDDDVQSLESDTASDSESESERVTMANNQQPQAQDKPAQSQEDEYGPLPTGWYVAKDPNSGNMYYYNHELGERQWGRPQSKKKKRNNNNQESNRRSKSDTSEHEHRGLDTADRPKQHPRDPRVQATEHEHKESPKARAQASGSPSSGQSHGTSMKRTHSTLLHGSNGREEHVNRQQDDNQHQQYDATSNTKSPERGSTAGSDSRRKLRHIFANYVPNQVWKYAGKDLDKDKCKRHARDIVEILVTKEMKHSTRLKSSEDLTEQKKRKIKAFVQDYMGKVVNHEKKRKPDATNEQPHSTLSDPITPSPKKTKTASPEKLT